MSLQQTSLIGAPPKVTGGVRPLTENALENAFPGPEISRIAESESWRKEVHRPATSTHKWWAKRLGSVFRGILAASVSSSEQEAVNGYSQGLDLDGLTVLDPFSGSGVTLVEAAKLGAAAIALDINPVATLVQRQAVQAWDGAELSRAFRDVESACRDEIDRVHRNEQGLPVLYYFWVSCADCPDCAARTRLFSSQVFAHHAYPRKHPDAQAVCPVCLDVVPSPFDFSRTTCANGHTFARAGAVKGGAMTCPNGHRNSIIAALGEGPPSHEMYAKLVLREDGSKQYEPITEFDRRLYAECEDLLSATEPELLVPRGELDPGENTNQAIRWGFRRWRQFFNARQLYSLGLLGAAIRDLGCRAGEREALAALFSGTLEFNNLFCSFKGEGTGAVRHMFSHHVLKPERTPLEAHPWGTPASSGSFSTLFERRLERAHSYKLDPQDQILSGDKVQRIGGISFPLEREIVETWSAFRRRHGAAYVKAGDASHTDLPDRSVDLVVTDPPYMDNVHYSELADFFHAWLRELHPFGSYPSDLTTTRNRAEVQDPTPKGFQAGITSVWRECHRVLKDNGLVAFTFHQARIGGWVALVSALADAEFTVSAIQPVKGEMSTSATKYGREPSNLDSIVVCRKSGQFDVRQHSPSEATEEAERKLAALRRAGVNVGAGDVRSVVRGHVLAAHTVHPEEIALDDLVLLADKFSSAAVERQEVALPAQAA